MARLLNEMLEIGLIHGYALFGAVAQMRYTEPVATLDADVLVDVPSPERLDVLTPLYEFCSKQGYQPEGEAIRVGEWPVQFIPVFSELTREAMKEADTADFEGVPLRVVRPEYLAVIALSVGRAKDWTRILALVESGSVTLDKIGELAVRYDLGEAWQTFQSRFINE